jgi:DNA polymerase-3 subunit beta
MKARFNREDMAEALSVICSVTAARTPKPILQCVKIEALPDVVLLSATDLETSVRYAAAQVEVTQTGSTVVAADTFSKIVRECADELLSLETAKNVLHIRGAGSHFQVVTLSPEEFPPVPAMEGEPDFHLDQPVLRQLVEWTVFAAARESSRYAINGVLWELDGENLSLVATDGRRLALARGKVARRLEKVQTTHAIVPVKVVSLFNRLPDMAGAPVGVRLTPNQFLMSIGRAVLSSALVEGQFPDYRKVVPDDHNKFVDVGVAALQGALRRAALLTNEESKAVRLSFQDSSLELTSRAPEQGEAKITLEVSYKGEPLEIGFNPVFLLDVLRVSPNEEVRLAFRDSNRSGEIRAGDDLLHVVMPVSLSNA